MYFVLFLFCALPPAFYSLLLLLLCIRLVVDDRCVGTSVSLPWSPSTVVWRETSGMWPEETASSSSRDTNCSRFVGGSREQLTSRVPSSTVVYLLVGVYMYNSMHFLLTHSLNFYVCGLILAVQTSCAIDEQICCRKLPVATK